MYLVDTNIYLEVLLGQEFKNECKSFLINNTSDIYISDFSVHSIGIILFRYDKKEIFNFFYNDISRNIRITALKNYDVLFQNSKRSSLDFDDLYQYCVAKENGLSIVTMDKDFKKIDDLDVKFIK